MSPLLKPHPSTPGAPVARIEAQASRSPGGVLELRYRLAGDTAGLVLPAPSAPERTDGLWRTTCFEAFVRAAESDAYVELNLSPSTAWAAYAFDGYRAGARPAATAPSRIEASSDADAFELSAVIDLAAAGLPPDAAWRIGLSAVIEARAGAISYWALAHPPGRPDFHSPDCFALELPAPQRP